MLIQIQTRLWKWISHCASVHVSGQPRSSWAQSLWLCRCPGVPQVQDHCRPARAQLLAMRPLSPDVTGSGVGTDLSGWHLSQVFWFKCCKKCLCSKALLKWALISILSCPMVSRSWGRCHHPGTVTLLVPASVLAGGFTSVGWGEASASCLLLWSECL